MNISSIEVVKKLLFKNLKIRNLNKCIDILQIRQNHHNLPEYKEYYFNYKNK